MIELFSILIQILVVTVFCYFPKNAYSFIYRKKGDFFQCLETGAIFNIFILLCLSLFFRKYMNELLNIFLIIYFIFNLLFLVKDNFLNFNKKIFKFNSLIIFFFLLIFLFSVDLANNLKIGWDAQNYWLVKKQIFTNGGDILDLKYTPRDDYPYLGSYLWHMYSKLSFLGYEYFGRIFYIYLFVLSIFAISQINNLKKIENIILILLIIFLIYKINLFNGYQEILNFSLLILMTKKFYIFFKNKNLEKNFYLTLAPLVLIINSVIWIKNEGAVLAMIFLGSIFLLKNIRFHIKIFLLSSFMFLILGKYFLFDYIGLANEIQKGNYEYFRIQNFFDFINLNRIFLVFKYILFYSLEVLIYPISIIILLILINFDKKNSFILFMVSLLVLSSGFILLAFLLTSFPLEWHLWVALDRIMFQTSGFFIILIPLFYDFLKGRNLN